jgi:hypothetical protein
MQKKIDEAMDSVLNIERATPTPFFYTRLQARMANEETGLWEALGRLVARPAFAAATVSLVLMMNIYVVFHRFSPTDDAPAFSEFASSEDLRTTTYYDLENVQP